MMEDLQPEYTPEQLRELEHADELEKQRDELNADWLEAMRSRHHDAHYKQHCTRVRFVEELRGLLDVNIDEHTENVQDKVKALLKKYDVPTFPVIFVNGEYHSDYTEEIETELNANQTCYAVYHITARQKEAVLKQKLSELEIRL